jgi:hypothetical protein
MRIALLLESSRRRAGLLSLAAALSATACGFETIEPVRRQEQAGPDAPASSVRGVINYGVPAASEIDFAKSSPVTTSDLTY